MAAALTSGELIALSVLFGVTILLCAAFLAYTIFGKDLPAIRESGVLSLLIQFSVTALVAYSLVIMMAEKVVSTDAGLPALTGLVGFLVGKAPSATK